VTVPKRNDHPNRSESLARDAIAWVVRLNSGDATLDDVERLLEWRARSRGHESAFRDAVKCWHAIGSALAVQGSTTPAQQRGRRKRKARP
jgi:ferric-dicitrate binding protein FerR (iron transport regulator)